MNLRVHKTPGHRAVPFFPMYIFVTDSDCKRYNANWKMSSDREAESPHVAFFASIDRRQCHEMVSKVKIVCLHLAEPLNGCSGLACRFHAVVYLPRFLFCTVDAPKPHMCHHHHSHQPHGLATRNNAVWNNKDGVAEKPFEVEGAIAL